MTHPDDDSFRLSARDPEPRLDINAVTDASGNLVVTVVGDVNLVSAPDLRERLLWLLRSRPPLLLIRMDQVSFLDSTGLSALVAVHRRADLLGVDVRLVAPAHSPDRVLHLTGMDTVFAIHPSIDDALRGDAEEDEPESSGTPA